MVKIVKLLVRKISEHPKKKKKKKKKKKSPMFWWGSLWHVSFFLVFFILMSFCTVFIESYTALHNLFSHISIYLVILLIGHI